MSAAQGEAVCVRAVVTGRVQGVWYRGWTMETARGLGLTGWVRNRADGSVEAVFHGSAESVAAMLTACRRGPPAAVVADVAAEPAPPPEATNGFERRPTA